MATIITINPTDAPKNSRADINTNFNNLNNAKAEKAGDTFTGQVQIIGSGDVVQLIIKGKNGQTVNIVEFRKSDNTVLWALAASGSLGLGTGTPDPAALLDLESTTKGFLPPRMTTTQRNAIASPPSGL